MVTWKIFTVTKREIAFDTCFASHPGWTRWLWAETEILGQAKKAYEAARIAGAAGKYLHRLFQTRRSAWQN